MNIPPMPPAAPAAVPPAVQPPPGGTAATQPAVPGALAPAHTFAELYSTPTADVHAGVYRLILALFATNAAV